MVNPEDWDIGCESEMTTKTHLQSPGHTAKVTALT